MTLGPALPSAVSGRFGREGDGEGGSEHLSHTSTSQGVVGPALPCSHTQASACHIQLPGSALLCYPGYHSYTYYYFWIYGYGWEIRHVSELASPPYTSKYFLVFVFTFMYLSGRSSVVGHGYVPLSSTLFGTVNVFMFGQSFLETFGKCLLSFHQTDCLFLCVCLSSSSRLWNFTLSFLIGSQNSCLLWSYLFIFSP